MGGSKVCWAPRFSLQLDGGPAGELSVCLKQFFLVEETFARRTLYCFQCFMYAFRDVNLHQQEIHI